MTRSPGDDFMEKAGGIALSWIDATPIAEALEAEYRRGRDDMLADVLRLIGKSAPCVAALRGAGEEDPATPPQPDQPDSNAKAAPPEPRSASGAPRPKGIPTTFSMARAVLMDEPDLTSREVADRIEKRWWPGMRFNQVGPEFYAFIYSGRMVRDADGKLRLTERGRAEETTDNRLSTKGTQPPQPKARAPASPPAAADEVVVDRPAATAKPEVIAGLKYSYCGRSIVLEDREHAIVSNLGINSGWLPFAHLVSLAFKPSERRPMDAAAWLRGVEPAINGKIKHVGLQLRLVPKMGYALVEATA